MSEIHALTQASSAVSAAMSTAPRVAQHDDSFAHSFATSYAGVLAFVAVATEGSFARAGERLGIGRSAVSRNVQKLEAQLDARLFLRTTRRTSLTHEGELFYAHCRPGVERIVRALDEMRDLRRGPPRGQLRIRATSGFGRAVVAPLLRGFHARYPDIALDLLLGDASTSLAESFAAERIDVVFRDGRVDDDNVIARRLLPMRLHVCASPAYARQHGLPPSIDDLAAHRCINVRDATGRIDAWEFDVDGSTRRVTPLASRTFNDPHLALQAVREGEGLAQLAHYQVRHALSDGSLLSCLDRYASADRAHYVCYPSRKHLPARVRVFVDYMVEHTRALEHDEARGIDSTSTRQQPGEHHEDRRDWR